MKTANCPACGAAIRFQSAVSILTVCEYCKSTLIRHDLNLENIGKMAELLPDSSPVQLGAEGVYRKTRFTVVGRIQLRYGQGIWNEWYLLFENQRGGWLGETLGHYAITFLIQPSEPLPPFSELRAGQAVTLKGRAFQVSNLEKARCVAGEGELPIKVGVGYEAPVADLQASGKLFATLDYSEDPPLTFVGEQVLFDDLKLTGLRPLAPAGWEPDAGVDARALQCPGCGISLPIRAKGHSETLACGACGSVIDLSDPNFRVLSQFKARIRHEPLIPLGGRGRFEETEYEAIGYLRRRVTVDGIDYEWSEYLLFHREQGFRWLVEYNGHWNLAQTVAEPPLVTGYGAQASAADRDRSYRHFQTATAEVSYVVGEFYWRVSVGERCEIQDYIAPPFQLSLELSDKEAIWSRAVYLEPETVKTAFQLATPLPTRIGVGASQPSPYEAQRPKFRRLLWRFLALLVAGQVLVLLFSSGQRVHQQTFLFDAQNRNQPRTSEPFVLRGRPSNLVIRAQTNLDNNWIYFDLALIERDSGASYAIGRELGYYQGVDEGERWSEGDAGDEAILSAIPAGTYYLSVEAEASPGAPTVTGTFTLFRDVPGWSNFFLALAGLLLLPLALRWRMWAYERARWAESDHASSATSESDDDD